MIVYFYLFIPLVCRLVESSSVKGRNHKNDLVPFLSSRLDTQKDNSLKIVSNEPFIIQFQMPQQSSENVRNGAKAKDKKKKRSDKKRVSKIKPLRKRIRKRRDVSVTESKEELHSTHAEHTGEKIQNNQNKTQNSISRLEMLKALNAYARKKETRKIKPEGVKNLKDVEKSVATSSRNPQQRNNSPPLPDRDPHVKMMYPDAPKSESNNYSYKDLIADRERLEQKINYIRNMLNVNDTSVDDGVRVRRRSDSDKTANKIAKMFLTLSAVNGLHDKRSKCHDDDEDDRGRDIWEKERKKSSSRQSSSSNEERYKVKKWIEYMKSKRSSGKTCPCMANDYNEENDVFPLEQKLAKDYQLTETGGSSEEFSDAYRDPLSHLRGRSGKSALNRYSNREDARNKLRALASRGRRKYELPIDDLELYRSRAKQILQNAEEILDKIKEEEEKRLAAPQAIASQLRELTSRIQGDPRNNENDLIKIIQKNLGWIPQSKSQSNTDNNSFVENMKSFILDPYEKARALTDESTRKLSSYLLRNLGKIDSSEEGEEATGKDDESPQVYHGQIPQKEEMLSANLAKENSGSDTLSKVREEHKNWSDTLSAMLGGNNEEVKEENNQKGETKQVKAQEDLFARRMEEMIKEQEKKINEYVDDPEKSENAGKEETTVIDLMTGEKSEKTKDGEKVAETFEPEKQSENIEKSIPSQDVIGKEPETVKSTAEEPASDVTASEHTQPSEDHIKPQEFSESVRESPNTEREDDQVRADTPLELQDTRVGVGEVPEDETVAENVEKAKADENQDEDVKDVVLEPAKEFEEKETEKVQVSVSPQEEQVQDDKLQSKQDREENDVVNSKHLILEGPERSEYEELEELTEDIQKLLRESAEEDSEVTPGQDNSEEPELKKEYESSEAKDLEDDVREASSFSEPVKLEKPTEEETQHDSSSENKDSSTGVVQASQYPKESQQYESSKESKASEEKVNSAEVVESEVAKDSGESFVESEKPQDSVEDLLQKGEMSVESEKEKVRDDTPQEIKSAEKETEREGDTLKAALADDEVEVTKESDDEDGDEKKEILKESLDEIDQGEPSLKTSLNESVNEQEPRENPSQKSLEEGEENVDASTDESPLRSENPEKETSEETRGEISLKATKQEQENSEVNENEEAALQASKPENTDEIRDASDEMDSEATGLGGTENVEQIREEVSDKESEEAGLRLEKESETNESSMDASGNEEKVKAAEDETLKEKNTEGENEKSIHDTLKATAVEVDDNTEESESDEKVEEQHKEIENQEESIEKSNLNEEEKETPKLVMSIKGGLDDDEDVANQEKGSEENDSSEKESEDDVKGENIVEEVTLKEANPETDQEQTDVQNIHETNDVNVRADHIKDLDNEIDEESLTDGKLRSAETDSEGLNEDVTLKEVSSLEQENFNKEEDVVEGANQTTDVTLGKKKNAPASEIGQSSAPTPSRSSLKVPKSIGKIMRDLEGKEKGDYMSLTNLNPEKIDHIIDKIDEAEHRNKLESEDVDCRKECACADEMNTRSKNSGRYEIVKDFLHWVKDLQLNRVLSDE